MKCSHLPLSTNDAFILELALCAMELITPLTDVVMAKHKSREADNRGLKQVSFKSSQCQDRQTYSAKCDRNVKGPKQPTRLGP